MADSALRVSPLDPHDDETFAAYVDIYRRGEESSSPSPVAFQPPELRALLCDTTTSERWRGFLGIDPAGTPVAAGLVTTSMADNLDKAALALWVLPGHLRRGYGTTMAEALVAVARESERTTLMAELDYPSGSDETHPNRAFAAAQGFRLSNAELHRVLDLPVPQQHLDELAAEAAEHHESYSLVDYVDDDIPTEVLPSYLDLLNSLLTNAPSGEVDYEAGRLTPTEFRALAEVTRQQGRTAHRTVALDASGRAVAHSVLAVPRHDPGKVFQWDTLVSRDHRGQRLGLAVKVRNLATVQRLHPDRSIVHTWNAASNTHMIAVNEAMGFRVVNESAEYVRHLDA